LKKLCFEVRFHCACSLGLKFRFEVVLTASLTCMEEKGDHNDHLLSKNDALSSTLQHK
jgi:hypothetical protein